MADQPMAAKPQSRRPQVRTAALSMRIAPITRDELVERAAMNGRSVTQEADRALHDGLLLGKIISEPSLRQLLKIIGDPGLRPLLKVVSEYIAAGEASAAQLRVEGDWTQDPDCCIPATLAALRQLIEVFGKCLDIHLCRGLFEQALISVHRDRSGVLPGGFVERTEPADGVTVTRELTDAELAKFDALDRLPVRRRRWTLQRDENE
jgi:hypothetical protein